MFGILNIDGEQLHARAHKHTGSADCSLAKNIFRKFPIGDCYATMSKSFTRPALFILMTFVVYESTSFTKDVWAGLIWQEQLHTKLDVWLESMEEDVGRIEA